MTLQISSLQKGIVGSWNLDEQSFNPSTKRFTDKSAYSNHGTGHGTQLGSASPGFQADRMGQLAKAAPFNGTDDYVDIGDINVHGTDLTFSAWIYVNDVTADQRAIVTKFDSSGGLADYAFLFETDTGGSIRFYTYDGVTTKRKKTATGVVSTGAWHHVAVVYDETANDADIYVDAVLKPNSQLDDVLNKIQNVVTHVYVGGRVGGGDDMDGSLADVRMYNRTLSTTEITMLYESYNSRIVI